MKTVGENLRNLRISKSLTQKQLGEKIGYSYRTIGDWESNHTEPNISAIKKLIKIFNISYEELLDWTIFIFLLTINTF